MNIFAKRFFLPAAVALSLGAALTGCGGGGGGGGGGAAEVPLVQVTKTTPTNKATKVASASSITVEFGGSLDAATILAANVRLVGAGSSIGVNLSYDLPTRTLTIKPQEPLAAGVTYTVSLAGLRDIAGRVIDKSVFSFTVFISPNPKSTTFAAGGAISTITVGTLNANDKVVALTTYNAPGTDGVWDTPDDRIGSYTTIDYDDVGNPLRLTNFTSAGLDGIWTTTADNAVGTFSVKTYDANGNILRQVDYAGPGPDGKAFTPDDAVASSTSFVFNDVGLPTLITNFDAAGKATTFTTRTYDARNNLVNEVISNAGPDGVAGNADDTISSFSQRTYDAVGNANQRFVYKGAGPDGKAFTADDVLDYHASIAYNTSGNPTAAVFSRTAGVNGIWADNDDNIAGLVTFNFDTQGRVSRLIGYLGAGVDNVPFSTDDSAAIDHYTDYVYDAAGNQTLTTFVGKGLDNAWFTSDDDKGEAGSFFTF